MRAFYCGDLLWAIENGPCRTLLRKPPAGGKANEEFSLGGDYTQQPASGGFCNNPGSHTTNTPEATVPREGGVAVLTFDSITSEGEADSRVVNVTVPPYTGRYSRLYHVRVDARAMGYITQEGYDGVECPFKVLWLSNFVGQLSNFNSYAGTVIFRSDRCPIFGQVDHGMPDGFGRGYQQPGCDWTVTSSADWLIAEQVAEGPEEGLLKLSIDFTVEAIFNENQGRTRSAIITIASGGTTNTWEVRHSRT
jgi:hypothetical protein